MPSEFGHQVRLIGHWRRLVLAAMLILVAPALSSLCAPGIAVAQTRGVELPDPAAPKRVALTKARTARPVRTRKPFIPFDPAARAVVPAAGITRVTLQHGARLRAGSSAVSVTAPVRGTMPAEVTVTTVDQAKARAAGVHGVMFIVQGIGASGSVDLDVDTSTFSNAYGGDFGARLRLVRLPSCVLTDPANPDCRVQTRLGSAQRPLSGPVKLSSTGPVIVATAAAVSGPTGDYSATPLSPGGTWAAGGNTGAFSYSYPIAAPPGIGGVAPSIALTYNSSSQDARTASSNDQSSWLGDGWSSTDNYIERTYKSCSDVPGSGAPKGSGDQCWSGQILTLSLNGTSTAVVYDDTTHTFRPATDDAGITVDQLFKATNGTKNGEYFRVTDHGTQFYFGMNRLPGWGVTSAETNSAWTVPVYKAHDGVSDCSDSSTFADTACSLGYRFNLDYAVDPNGNAMAYYYTQEAGYYGANLKDTAVSYVRAGTLARIDYGMTTSTIYSAPAPEQVIFDATTERCIVGSPTGNTCSDKQFTVDHPEYWPDTPVDLNCTSGSKTCTNHSPSFWSRKRLTTIQTQVRVGGVVQPVDRYTLTQTFPDGGDHAPKLWLDSIQHTGLDRLGGAATDATTPPVTFGWTQIANRVGTLPGLPKMYHNRISTVTSEIGAETDIVYDTPANCTNLPAGDADDSAAQAFAAQNSTGCFPVYWTPEGQPKPLMDWFYTHPVSKVTTIDNNNSYQDGTQPRTVTEYKYLGKPGWHYDDNEVVKAKNRTWGQFRGYPEVDTYSGDPTVFHYTDKAKVYDQRTLTKTFYFLGMNADRLPDGARRDAPAIVSQDKSVTVPDLDAYAGQSFETVKYTGGDGNSIDLDTVTVPTTIGPTASRSRSGLPILTAQMVRPAKSLIRQAVSYGWRKTEKDFFYNTALGKSTTGMEVQSVDRGESGAIGNVAKCTFTRYVTTADGTQALPADVLSTVQDCTTADQKPTGDLIVEVRNSYDGHGFVYDGDGQSSPALPTAGNLTQSQQASASTGPTATAFVITGTTTFDDYGRPLTSTRTPKSVAIDGKTSLARQTLIRRTPSTGALPSSITTVTQVTPGVDCAKATASSVDCQVVTAVMDEARQVPTKTTGATGGVTSQSYDAFGRMAAVWLPNKSKTAQALPNKTFSYALSKGAPTVVTTKTLQDTTAVGSPETYGTSEVLYDALLRPLETQANGENTSVIVSDTQYDSHGWTVVTNNAYSVAGAPITTLISDHVSQVSIPDSTVTDHDGLGRPTQTTEQHNGAKTWTTRTAYTGDTTTVLPPAGGVSTTTVIDGRGQTTRFDQYTTAPNLSGGPTVGFTTSGGVTQSIDYEYTPAGNQSKVTAPDHSIWSFGYDLLGRRISNTDPDTGAGVSRFDDAGNLSQTRDARGIQLEFTYDLLGRKLTATDKTKNFKYASWTYDTLRIGELTSSTRYVNGVTGGYTVAATGFSTLGNPLGTKIILPSAEGPLPLEYTTTFAYTRNNELLAQQTDPAATGISSDVITHGYDPFGAPTTTTSNTVNVAATAYADFGQQSAVTFGASTNQAKILYSYDEQTLRLAGRQIYRSQGIGPLVDDISYTYDDAGNPLTNLDKQSESGNTVTDLQCFQYDTLARLAEAWTSATASCALDPTARDVSNASGAYWQSYAYDSVGVRGSLIDHSTTGGRDQTTTYVHGCTVTCNRTGAQPHTLTATTGNADPTALVYDAGGNLLTRTPKTAPGQTLKWDDENHLAEVDVGGAEPSATKYLYDADGNQLIRRDPGTTTLFAGDTEITLNTAVVPPVALGAVRTYTHGGSPIAVHSSLPGGGTSYLFEDPHGTSTLAMDIATQQLSRQHQKPYGEDRAAVSQLAWPDLTHGYLGKSKDGVTGYTDLGARKYDPTLGVFISADPLLETDNPNELGGYTYAGDNPIALSDPTGMSPREEQYQSTACNDACQAMATGGAGVSTRNNTDGSTSVGGVRVESGRTRDNSTYNQTVNKYWNSTIAAGQPDPTSRLLVAMALACQDEHSVCTASFASETLTAAALRAQYNNGCRGKCLQAYEKNIAGMDVLLSGALMQDAEGSNAKAANSAAAVTGEDQLLGLARGGSLGGCTGRSFSADTKVVMADGRTKPIKDVEKGDLVRTTDPLTGEDASRVVTATYLNRDHDLTSLITTDAHGRPTIIHTTANHPFWDDTRQSWVNAADLHRGDELRTVGGAHRKVVALVPMLGVQNMYNLTVADDHTYYVLAGTTPVLVHNCGSGRDLIDGDAQYHIITGNRTGGGHKWPGQPGKTVFPSSWDTDKILDGVADVATNPASTRTWQTGARGSMYTRAGDPSRVKIEGVYDGVNMRVIFEPANDRIVTAFPIG